MPFVVFLALWAQEPPTAFLVSGQGGEARWRSDHSYLATSPGDMFHTGDRLRSGGFPLTFLFCPDRIRFTLDPSSEVELREQNIRLLKGGLRDVVKEPDCRLPASSRRPAAISFHYGQSIFATQDLIRDWNQFVTDLASEQQATTRPPGVPVEDPSNSARLLSRIQQADAAGPTPQITADLRTAARTWPTSRSVLEKVFTHGDRIARQAVPADRPGLTRALLIGISRYEQRPRPEDSIPALQFAHLDAELMFDFFRSPRGGSAEDLRLLLNGAATFPELQAGFDRLLKSLRPQDTAVIVFSGHGTSQHGRDYLLAHDSYPGVLQSTAVSVHYLAEKINDALARARRVYVFVDACRGGALGPSLTQNEIYSSIRKLLRPDKNLFVFAACQRDQIAIEGTEYGGGHGAFMYYLYQALTVDLGTQADRQVTAQEVIDRVTREVENNTPQRQRPWVLAGLDYGFVITRTSLPGPNRIFQVAAAQTGVGIGPKQSVRGLDPRDVRTLIRDAERILAALGQSRTEEYVEEALRLAMVLEHIGQAVLVRYLQGEESPPQPTEFADCATAFATALRLVPESLWLRARMHFCRGREQIFAKGYSAAIDELQQSIRLDPAGAYSLNALGLAYLETARYERAIAAFQDAISRAPYWAYAWNNLALAQTQAGNRRAALEAYREGRRLSPNAIYLAYNYGLLLQLLNRRRESEAVYREIIARYPANALAHNALGSLFATSRRWRAAENTFREALRLDASLLSARHNLALVVARDRRRRNEAIALWQDNLARDPNHGPSSAALAQMLSRGAK